MKWVICWTFFSMFSCTRLVEIGRKTFQSLSKEAYSLRYSAEEFLLLIEFLELYQESWHHNSYDYNWDTETTSNKIEELQVILLMFYYHYPNENRGWSDFFYSDTNRLSLLPFGWNILYQINLTTLFSIADFSKLAQTHQSWLEPNST